MLLFGVVHYCLCHPYVYQISVQNPILKMSSFKCKKSTRVIIDLETEAEIHTRWMIPAEWMYCGQERHGFQHIRRQQIQIIFTCNQNELRQILGKLIKRRRHRKI